MTNANDNEPRGDRAPVGHGYFPVNCECPRHYHLCSCADCAICACAGEDACGGCGVWAKPRHGRTLSIAADRRLSQDEAVWEMDLAEAKFLERFPDKTYDDAHAAAISAMNDAADMPPAIHPAKRSYRTHAGEYAVSVGGMGDAPDEPPNYHELPLIYSPDLPLLNGVDPADVRGADALPHPVRAQREPPPPDMARFGDFIDAVVEEVRDAGAQAARERGGEVLTCGYCFHSEDTVPLKGGGAICRDLDQCAANERSDYETMLNDKAFMDEYSQYGSCRACGEMQFAGKLILDERGYCVDEHECARRAEELAAEAAQGVGFCPP